MDEEKKEFSWLDEAGRHIYGVEWPVPEARAVMGIVHGIGEHARRYDHYADWFTRHGIACIGFDRQGHGKSGGKRGHVADYRLFVDEVSRLTVECGQRYPGRPIILYGHSMGGQVLLRYLIRRNPSIAGAIISAPYIRLPFKPNPVKVLLARLMCRIKPDFTQSNPLDTELLCRDGTVVRRYREDPLVHDLISAKMGVELIENASMLDAYSGGLSIPTLMLHGDADGVTAFSATERFAARNPTGVTFLPFTGFYHELHNEPQWTTVAEAVLDWIERTLYI